MLRGLVPLCVKSFFRLIHTSFVWISKGILSMITIIFIQDVMKEVNILEFYSWKIKVLWILPNLISRVLNLFAFGTVLHVNVNKRQSDRQHRLV